MIYTMMVGEIRTHEECQGKWRETSDEKLWCRTETGWLSLGQETKVWGNGEESKQGNWKKRKRCHSPSRMLRIKTDTFNGVTEGNWKDKKE